MNHNVSRSAGKTSETPSAIRSVSSNMSARGYGA